MECTLKKRKKIEPPKKRKRTFLSYRERKRIERVVAEAKEESARFAAFMREQDI